MCVPLESRHMNECLLWLSVLWVLMFMSTSFSWSHGPTSLSQFSSKVVGQFGSIFTYKRFPILIWKDSKQLDHVGRQNSSFLMITGNSGGQRECSSWPPSLPPNSPVLLHTFITWYTVFTWGCSNRAQQSCFYLCLSLYLHGKHFYKRKVYIHCIL